MKIVANLIISASVALMVTGCSESANNNQETEVDTEETDQDQQVADLRKQLAQAKAKASRADRVEVVETAKVEVKGVVTDAEGLISRLADPDLTGEDIAGQRRVVHYFESLFDAQNDAVPAIASFLEESVDKQFGRRSMRDQLSITSTQMEEMRAYGESQREEIGTKMRELWSNQELSREERGEQMRAMFTDITEKYKEMMTPEQKAKLEELGGEEGAGQLLRGLLGGGPGRGGGDRGRGGGRGPGGR